MTRGLAKGIPEKFVMERTGHRDVRSLQKYQRPEVLTKVEISKVLITLQQGMLEKNPMCRKKLGKYETSNSVR